VTRPLTGTGGGLPARELDDLEQAQGAAEDRPRHDPPAAQQPRGQQEEEAEHDGEPGTPGVFPQPDDNRAAEFANG
jgi:hypothetical protein